MCSVIIVKVPTVHKVRVCVCVYFTAVACDLHIFHYPQLGQRPPGGEPWVSLTIASSMYK